MMQSPIVIKSEDWSDQDIITLARVVLPETLQPITQADISDVELEVFDMDGPDPESSIHFDNSISVVSVVLNMPVNDALWQSSGAPDTIGYNFTHNLSNPLDDLDAIPGHTIRLRYRLGRSLQGKAPLWVVHERRLLPNGSL